ncbi:MAG: LLM class flavin-dependent oxidoreductase [Myxococcota bacterium]|nr:LLM class flavin-dependent oxidoreductase [Myxococcota bacterium]
MTDLAVALGDHAHPLADVLALVQRAEALGYRAIYVDGDGSMRPSRPEWPVQDGWTVTTACLARTERIEIGSMRIVYYWNAARLAQAVATAEQLAPGRLRLLISIGGQPGDRRYGHEVPPVLDRIAWLDELLAALRELWTGEPVTARGRFVRLDEARVAPVPRGGRMPIEVGGRRARLLDVVAARADRWDVNLPPLADRIAEAAALLDEACRAHGRDQAEIGRSLWVLTRVGARGAGAREAFRRWNPWFRDVPDESIELAMLCGPAGECRQRIGEMRTRLGIDLPVIDLSGLDRKAAEQALEALAGA